MYFKQSFTPFHLIFLFFFNSFYKGGLFNGDDNKMKRLLVVLFILFVFISSLSVINAQEIDANQTDNSYFEIALSAVDDSKEGTSGFEPETNLSAVDNSNGDSYDFESEILSANVNVSKSSLSYNQSGGNNQKNVLASSYLVLDNDADKENIYLGDYVTWILEAQNFGPDVAKNTKIHDKLPEGLKYIDYTATKGVFDSKTGIWDIGDLEIEDGLARLFILTKSFTVGEKVNVAYITSDTFNSNNETYEEEEIDVFLKENSKTEFEKHVSAKMHETGNPLFLIFISVFMLMITNIRK